MKKIWSYISVFLAGALLMAIATLKWFAGDDYKIGINKLKQKGKGNTLESQLDVNLPTQTKPEGRLSQWKNRRKEKKKLRVIKRSIN